LIEPLLKLVDRADDASQFDDARMISMFTATARSLRRTPESIATPCSVKTYGA